MPWFHLAFAMTPLQCGVAPNDRRRKQSNSDAGRISNDNTGG